MTTPEKPSAVTAVAKASLDWVTLALQAISLIEKILPAVLVSWNDYIRSQNKQLQTQLNYEKAKNEIAANEIKNAPWAGDAESLINNFLDKQ